MEINGRRGIALIYGLACHGMFAAGVGMMIVQMYSGMTTSFGTLASPYSWLVNGLLLIQFPLAHSVLLSGSGRRLLSRLAPKAIAVNLSTTTYVIIASVQVLLLFSLWSPSGVVWWQAQGGLFWTLTALYAASWLLLGLAIRDAGMALQTGALGWWAVFRNSRPVYPRMPSRGLFRLCRQPIYLAFACTVWTVPVWTPDQLVVAAVLTAYCLIGPIFKEKRFSKVFGQQFADYQARKPYWLPTLRPLFSASVQNDLTIYDRFADHWWDGSQRWLRTLQNLVPARLEYFDRIVDWRGKAVLDLGCGGGFMSEAIASKGANVTGIDPAERAIAIARSHASLHALTIHYLVGTGERLPMTNESVDYVVCVDVLEHVNDLPQAIAEIHRVLRPGGVLLFDTISRNWLAHLVIVILGERVFRILPVGTHDAAKFIPPAMLAELLRAKGFTVSEFTGLGPRGVNKKLDFVYGRLPTTQIMYIGHATRHANKIGLQP